MTTLTERLKNEIYPAINANAAGFLSHLNAFEQDGTFFCKCPNCGYKCSYKSGHSGIKCIDGCKEFISLWDVLKKRGHDNKQIWQMLSQAANISSKTIDTKKRKRKVQLTEKLSQLEQIQSVIRDSLLHSEKAKKFAKGQGWSIDELLKTQIGYMPSIAIITSKLKEKGLSDKAIKALGFLDDPKLEKCLVIPWEHPSGGFKLVGMRTDTAEIVTQKNFNKSIPKGRINPSGITYVTANPFVAAKIESNGYYCLSTLSTLISKEQCVKIKNMKTDMHWIFDNEDKEGRNSEQTLAMLSSLDIQAKVSVTQSELTIGNCLDEMNKMILLHQSIPDFIARRFLKSKHNRSSQQAILRMLNKQHNKELRDIMKSHQQPLHSDLAQSLRVLAQLIDFGLTEQQASAAAKSMLSDNDRKALESLITRPI